MIKDFIKGISNLISYFKIIWYDRDWDHAFIYKLLIFKLKRTAKCLRKYDRYEGVERDCEIIDTVVRLLERDIEEYYGMEYMDFHKSQFKSIPTNRPGISQLELEVLENNLQEYFKKYPRTYKKIVDETDRKSDDLHIAINMGYHRQEKCHKLAFELLKRNIRRWWD